MGRDPRGGPPALRSLAGRVSGIDLADSVVYGHLWATEETRALFDDEGRTRAWLDIIAALAEEQAELGLIPAAAARQLAACRAAVDLDAVGEETRATGHSTLGLIRVLREQLRAGGAPSGSTTARPSRTSPTRGSAS